MNRVRAWLVTGALGRGLAFAIDFAVAASRTMLRRAALGSPDDADDSQELPDHVSRSRPRSRPQDVERAANRAARAMAREMRLPGFRKGKAPPSLVIQRLGFAAVLAEAIREALPEWYEARAARRRGRRRSATPSIDIVSTPEAIGEPLDLQVRGRRAAGRRARRVQRPRGRPGRAKRSTRRSSTPRSTGSARASRSWSRSSARPPRGRLGADRLRGLRRRPAFQGGKADDYLLDARLGPADRRLRGAADRGEPGDEVEVEVTFPDEYQAEETGRQGRVFKVEGEGGAGENPARARRRLRLRRLRVRHPRGAARRHPRESSARR